MVILDIILLALAAGLLVGIFLRFYAVTLPPVTLVRVAPPYAASILAEFLEGATETRFGFPSGIFRIDKANCENGARVTVKEMKPEYSVTDGCAALSTSAGAGLLAGADGCFELCLALAAFIFIAGPIWILNLTEKLYRKVLESEVRADLVPVTDPDGTQVTIRLRGVNAILLRKTYEEALHRPKLPEDIAIAAGVIPPPQRPGTPPHAGEQAA
jgi:hypothetical protein